MITSRPTLRSPSSQAHTYCDIPLRIRHSRAGESTTKMAQRRAGDDMTTIDDTNTRREQSRDGIELAKFIQRSHTTHQSHKAGGSISISSTFFFCFARCLPSPRWNAREQAHKDFDERQHRPSKRQGQIIMADFPPATKARSERVLALVRTSLPKTKTAAMLDIHPESPNAMHASCLPSSLKPGFF